MENIRFYKLLFSLTALLMASCQVGTTTGIPSKPLPPATPSPSSSTLFTPIPTQKPTVTPFPLIPTGHLNPKDSATKNPVTYDPVSPLKNIELDQLTEILSSPFSQPGPGQDDGHHGADFSFYRFGAFNSIEHQSIVAILPGIVSAVINDSPPYGNAIIIETSWSKLSNTVQMIIGDPQFPEEIIYTSYINCPMLSPNAVVAKTTDKSLYVLYGHMESAAAYLPGDEILQSQEIGTVGNSGMSGNPHLHLETRVGPAHATFSSMAHYDNKATIEEMANYCFWRVSKTFILFDPMLFFP